GPWLLLGSLGWELGASELPLGKVYAATMAEMGRA
ncbi:MAG: hypothetical protein QOE49_3951, partial [Rhodospirillaceae bacterium]|nr:hypothetical protein [Rhodospirillaceae bacterium]